MLLSPNFYMLYVHTLRRTLRLAVEAQPGCATFTSDLASAKPRASERFCFDLVSTQLRLCMAPKKRSSTGSVKTAFVEIKHVKPGQTVSVKGKVLSKSGTRTLGDVLWDCVKFGT